MKVFGVLWLLAAVSLPAIADESSVSLLEGAWDEATAQPLLDKTLYLHIGYDADAFTPAERAAAAELIAAGHRLHALYLQQRHPQGRAVQAALDASTPQHLRDLFRAMKGPIATTLANEREAFLNVVEEVPGKNVYPAALERKAMDEYLAANPTSRKALLHLRSIVVEATAAHKQQVLDTLDSYPVLDTLHPGLREQMLTASTYLPVPYSVAYPEDVLYVYDRLSHAAALIEQEDVSFARYLRARARDLLADDYDAGDAAWVTGDYAGSLNAQIGAYETYDDALYGVKAFFSLSLLQRDKARSEELARAIGDIQSIEDALPYATRKRVRSDIPVGVYNIVADFGQARGTNTATILPNEGHLSRQFGRIILIRSTILRNPILFAEARKAFVAATAPQHHEDLDIEGGFYRTLWHEIGHYLGPDQTRDGGDIDAALQDTADLFEEMKSDLVSLFASGMLAEQGYHSPQRLRAIYAGGIRRVLQKNRPRRDQAYGTMQLIQWNWFLDQGLLRFEDDRLHIDYDRYPATVTSLLAEVLRLQYEGDREAAVAFVKEWTDWDEGLHEVIAGRMRDAEGARFRHVTYEALGEAARY
jgi:hypothetical protein